MFELKEEGKWVVVRVTDLCISSNIFTDTWKSASVWNSNVIDSRVLSRKCNFKKIKRNPGKWGVIA
jgi:hypothetical protein